MKELAANGEIKCGITSVDVDICWAFSTTHRINGFANDRFDPEPRLLLFL